VIRVEPEARFEELADKVEKLTEELIFTAED
jgi:hypothetical protein